jgi:hypothetical protein
MNIFILNNALRVTNRQSIVSIALKQYFLNANLLNNQRISPLAELFCHKGSTTDRAYC